MEGGRRTVLLLFQRWRSRWGWRVVPIVEIRESGICTRETDLRSAARLHITAVAFFPRIVFVQEKVIPASLFC